ncbi:MAG: BrnT family toxin [Caulobacteraceae bacterium]
MRFVFDWDPRKAAGNLAKHGVSFDDAMTVVLDPDALTIFDPDHSDAEDRWVTIGEATGSKVLLAIHTYVDGVVSVRIISARRPARREAGEYRRRVQ